MEHNNPDDVGHATAPQAPSEAPTVEAPKITDEERAAAEKFAQDEVNAPSADPEIVSADVLRQWEQASVRDSYMMDQTRVVGDRMAQEVRHLRDKVRHLELEVQRLA